LGYLIRSFSLGGGYVEKISEESSSFQWVWKPASPLIRIFNVAILKDSNTHICA
jgi:hypothetical protein